MELSYIILLGFAVSIDGFFAGIAYGIKTIKVPYPSLLTIGLVTLICTGLSSIGSHALLNYLNPVYTTAAGSLLLIAIGLTGIARQFYQRIQFSAAQSPDSKQGITFSLGKIVIRIMAKPECADMDESKILSVTEALLLGLALGMDNMVATFAAGLVRPLPVYTPLVMCVIQTSLVFGGIYCAGKITSPKIKNRLAYAPGILLICLGLFRMI